MKFVPRHNEAFSFWNKLFYGFRRPFRDLAADDVTPSVKSKFHQAVSEIMKFQNKQRFIAEYSGWSRIGFIKTIFPDAQFIHIVRDGRAVANSLTNVAWWMGWEGVYKWRWGTPSQDLQKKLEKYDYSFLALAALHWKILINNIVEKSRSLSKDEILLIRYEDLTKDPHKLAHKCIEFSQLDKNCKKFKKHLATVKIVDANSNTFRIPPWKSNFTTTQIDMLDDLLEEELVRFDYL